MLPVELPCLPLPNVLCMVSTDRVLVQILVASGPDPPRTMLSYPSRLLAVAYGLTCGMMDFLPNPCQSSAVTAFF